MTRVTIGHAAFWTYAGYPRYADMGKWMLTIHLTVLRLDGGADLYVT